LEKLYDVTIEKLKEAINEGNLDAAEVYSRILQRIAPIVAIK
jgi:hypothetical protein